MSGEVMDLLRQTKKMQYRKLTEFMDLSEQLDQAIKRKDDVSAKLILAMREEPLTQMWEMEQGIETQLLNLPQEEAVRGSEILSAARLDAPGDDMTPEEAGLYEQAASVFRLLRRAEELDKRISIGICGEGSFYNKYR